MAQCLTISLGRYDFKLNKSNFRNGFYLRYGWEASKNPLTCACSKNFNLTHALHCAKGGYTHRKGEISVKGSTTAEDEPGLDIQQMDSGFTI